MESLYLNNTEFVRFCNLVDSLRRSKNKEISFQSFVGSSTHPSSENMKARKFLCFMCERVASSEARLAPTRTRMRTLKYKATTRSARCNHCSFSKWVRAKVSKSPHLRASTRPLIWKGLVLARYATDE